MKNLSTDELANLPTLSFTLNMSLDKTDEKSLFSNLIEPLGLMIASDQFKHWKPGEVTHTIFEGSINKGDKLQFVITFKIVYAPYQYDIKATAISRLSEVLSQLSFWSHRIRDGVDMTILIFCRDEIMITRNINDN